MSAYSYASLDQEYQIRLLKLEPGEAADPIQCSLVPISLLNAIDYESLSYCWGDPAATNTISCHDGRQYGTLGIAAHLHAALVGLRHKDKPRTLWIDAICINQHDMAEKAIQIGLMSRIYSQAMRVVVWLDEAGADISNLDRFIDKALELTPDSTFDNDVIKTTSETLLSSAMELEKEGKLSWRHINWTRLHNLLARHWFERKWVIQEVAFARDAVVMCGGLELSWPKIADLTFRVSQYQVIGSGSRTPTVSLAESQDRVDRIYNAMVMLMIKTFMGQATVLDCVLASKKFKCTSPHDHVYALLSLANAESAASIKVDYTSKIQDVFTDFAISCLISDRSLAVLSIPSSGACRPFHLIAAGDAASSDQPPLPDPLPGLPSWVPDLTALSAEALASYSILPRQFFAGGYTPPSVTVHPCRTRLTLHKSILIDTVGPLAPWLAGPEAVALSTDSKDDAPFDGMDETESSNLRKGMAWVQKCLSLAGIADLSAASVQEGRDFCRTLMCDLTGMRDRLKDDVVDAFRRQTELSLKVVERKIGASWSVYEDAGLAKYAAQFQSSLIQAGYRRFCVPRNAEEGDRVVVFSGAEVLHVIRERKDEKGVFELIGEAYVHGLMDEEVLKLEGVEKVDVVLV
ncbi:heterokaryon incompatibility protein-domain-containing protein [Bombardia bombarda]|uniref:Heterokaryon incompatibility protein-domain-containing protein n=1 Tax=Bombardia bombarda TaxID=252184 RepID=A0AA39XI61_9PEZI|nr:heterokaryon incompatibility protein-domain-containing protein [Bombardia bombarda]